MHILNLHFSQFYVYFINLSKMNIFIFLDASIFECIMLNELNM